MLNANVQTVPLLKTHTQVHSEIHMAKAQYHCHSHRTHAERKAFAASKLFTVPTIRNPSGMVMPQREGCGKAKGFREWTLPFWETLKIHIQDTPEQNCRKENNSSKARRYTCQFAKPCLLSPHTLMHHDKSSQLVSGQNLHTFANRNKCPRWQTRRCPNASEKVEATATQKKTASKCTLAACSWIAMHVV